MVRIVGDKFTPDHQPQAAVLKSLGEEEILSKNLELKKVISGGHADGAMVINLHHQRHSKGRTYSKSPKEFNTALDTIIFSSATDKEKRTKIVKLVKTELVQDVNSMKDVASSDINSPQWSDINNQNLNDDQKKELRNKIKKQIESGENQLLYQNFKYLENE